MKIDNGTNIAEFQWFEQKKKDNKSSLGYGARFDPFFKRTVKVNDVGDNAVSCHWTLPWWMSSEPQFMAAMKRLRGYHIVPNMIEGATSDDDYDDGREAYRDYVENAGPKFREDRKRKSAKVKPKRKICSCKKK